MNLLPYRYHFEAPIIGVRAKIVDACREALLPDPQYSEESGGMLVTLMKSRMDAVDYKRILQGDGEGFGRVSEGSGN